jgi:hypothetical protein
VHELGAALDQLLVQSLDVIDVHVEHVGRDTALFGRGRAPAKYAKWKWHSPREAYP